MLWFHVSGVLGIVFRVQDAFASNFYYVTVTSAGLLTSGTSLTGSNPTVSQSVPIASFIAGAPLDVSVYMNGTGYVVTVRDLFGALLFVFIFL